MEPAKAPKLRDLFEKALSLPPIDRARFLTEIQLSSPLIYGDLRSLLFAHQAPEAFFEKDGGLWAQIAPTSFIGRRFGPYVIDCEIGRGGMGTVYRANRADDSFDKTVAIKVIAGAGSAASLDAFRRERQILASLEHPNISRLLDGGATEDGLLFLVMEYVDGRPLDRYVSEEIDSLEGSLRLFLPICEAVAYAHRNLIVHRDLKPSNILVDSLGSPRLLDFGIAKVLDPNSSNTATQALRLTPDFASPEQIRGEPISTASDIYSLGVVLFHLVTGGARPYRTTSPGVQELLSAILERPTIAPSTIAAPNVAKRLRGDIDNIVMKAMAKEIPRRYSTVEQLADDIRRHLDGRPVLARPVTLAYRTSKFVQRNRLRVGAAALLALSIAAGILSTLQQADIARRESIAAQQERRSAIQAREEAEAQRKRAEEERLEADQQRLLAEQQQRLAQQQFALAQQSSAEAKFQSQRAEQERATATQRYQSVRSLATSVLFDVNDALRNVPGSGPSRMKAIVAALNHLESLAKNSNDDVELLIDLANAYERIGEILTGLFAAEGEPGNAPVPAFQKALSLRNRIAAKRPNDPSALQQKAEAKRLLANSFVSYRQFANAMPLLADGLSDLEAAGNDPATLQTRVQLHADLCQAFLLQSNPARATTACESALEIAPRSSRFAPLRLMVLSRFVSALRANNAPDRAVTMCRSALQLAREEVPLQPPQLQQWVGHLRALKSWDALGEALRLYGLTLQQEQKRDAALEAFEESLLLRSNGSPNSAAAPQMREVLAYAEASQLQNQAWFTFRRGEVKKAAELSRQAIGVLGSSTAGSARVLQPEIEANLRQFELALAEPAHPPKP